MKKIRKKTLCFLINIVGYTLFATQPAIGRAKIWYSPRKAYGPATNPTDAAYDYSRIMNLIHEHRIISTRYHRSHAKFTANRQNNLNHIKAVLRNLYSEKRKFYDHFRRSRNDKHRSIPRKKINALKFYNQALQDAIDDLEKFCDAF